MCVEDGANEPVVRRRLRPARHGSERDAYATADEGAQPARLGTQTGPEGIPPDGAQPARKCSHRRDSLTVVVFEPCRRYGLLGIDCFAVLNRTEKVIIIR